MWLFLFLIVQAPDTPKVQDLLKSENYTATWGPIQKFDPKADDDDTGELYLSGSPSGAFTAHDQRIVEMLAAHAGIAIATANLVSQ